MVSNHIQADDSETSIAQAIVMVNGTVSIGTPKSNDSYRTMPTQGSARHNTRQLRQTEDKFVGESLKKPVQLCTHLFPESVLQSIGDKRN